MTYHLHMVCRCPFSHKSCVLLSQTFVLVFLIFELPVTRGLVVEEFSVLTKILYQLVNSYETDLIQLSESSVIFSSCLLVITRYNIAQMPWRTL